MYETGYAAAGETDHTTHRRPRPGGQGRENGSDPDCAALRKRGMLTEPTAIEIALRGVAPCRLLAEGAIYESSVGKAEVSVNQEDEARWVACLKRVGADRDEAAFAELFRHFAPRVKAFLARSGTGEALAEECAQDVMATVWHKAHMFDPSRASVATWVFAIARNRKIDLLRRQRRPEPEDLPWGPEAEPDQADIMVFRQESEKLAEAIRNLPAKQRVLIERAFFGDLTHAEIARATGLPLGTIKSRIRLALERLRHSMS